MCKIDCRRKLSFFCLRNPVLWSFILSFLYWAYLSFATNMEIKHDAQGYQHEALKLYQDGLEGFFKVGPSHVVFHPTVIAFSMFLRDLWGFSHFAIQKWIQIFFLFAAQILLYFLLRKLNVHKKIITVTILYFGFSPALVNAALCSWSEITSLPFVLLLVWASIYSWKKVQGRGLLQLVQGSVILAVAFFLITMIREVYEYVVLIYVFFYFILVLGFLFRKMWKNFWNAIVILALFVSLYYLALSPYKEMNYKYNGYRSLVLKGGVSVYGETFVRTQKMSLEKILSFLSYVAGEHVVKKLFGEDDFTYWYYTQYDYGPLMQSELMGQGVPRDQLDVALYQRSIQNILGNPLQYIFLTMAEGCKLFFWESTRIGFVDYPPWLDRIYQFTPFKNGLRLLMFLLTFISLLFTIKYIWQHGMEVYPSASNGNGGGTQLIILIFIIIIIISNFILHAPFIIETRYGTPLAALYLILIANLLNQTCSQKSVVGQIRDTTS